MLLFQATTAEAQSDWGRAEDEAVGDQTEDAAQAEVLLSEPQDDEDEEDEEEQQDREEASEDDDDEDAEQPQTDDFRLFGHMEGGGAIRFFGDIGTFFGTVSVTSGVGAVGQTEAFSLTPWFGISYGITDKLILGAEWGFSILPHGEVRLTSGTNDGGLGLTAGNPTIFARWIPFGAEDEVSWGIDLSVGFPAAAVNSAAEAVAVASAIGSRGAWDLFHWIQGGFSVVPGLFLDWEPAEGFVLHGEADLALIFGTSAATYSTVGVLQLAIDASYRFVEAMALGLRLTGVLMGEEASPTRDTFQLAMSPYLALFADPLFIRGEFLLNITEPYGTSFTDGKWWGARLVAGLDL
jgi:hypothetical protein